MFPVRPLYDRVIIKPIEPPSESDGGIIIAERARNVDHCIGRVVAVGDGKKTPAGDLILPPVAIGDVVAYQSAWQGEKFSRDGIEYHVLENEDCAAILADGVRFEHLR